MRHTLTLNAKKQDASVQKLPPTTDIDIAHLSTGLFTYNLLRYEDVTQLARSLNKLLRGKEFPSRDGQHLYHILKVIAIAHRVIMRVYEVQPKENTE